MSVAWALSVLPAGIENLVELDHGDAPTTAAAHASAVDALLRAVRTGGRQEYRLTIDGLETIVLPGLAERGDVATEGLSAVVRRVGTGADAAVDTISRAEP